MKKLIKYGHDSRHFSGLIYENDFCTNHPPKYNQNKGSRIASMIESNFKFDRDCERNIYGRDKCKGVSKL